MLVALFVSVVHKKKETKRCFSIKKVLLVEEGIGAMMAGPSHQDATLRRHKNTPILLVEA